MLNTIIKLVNNFFARLFGVVTILFTILTIFKEFNVLKLERFGIYGILSLILISVVIAVLTIPFKINSERGKRTQAAIEMKKKINQRVGTLFSSRTDNHEVIDKTHHFYEVYRQDLLDYSQRDYHSIRVLKGFNKSKELSDGLIYSESTEYKVAFNQIEIKAIDLKTNNELVVECLDDEGKKLNTHVFKINFRHSIKPAEEFEIGYYIKFPEELGILNDSSEIMSISLSRITRGVDVLNFNLCLNFKPRSVKLYSFDINKGAALINSECTVEEYIARSRIEEMFEIKWSSKPYVINMHYKKPDRQVYIIEYLK
ncbi:hypothetical protein CHH60_27080 [Paenibacillus sp. 7523-1]|nr:hypothetical protein CHH60_27080 [Paenibacillus sp. 7523-1]